MQVNEITFWFYKIHFVFSCFFQGSTIAKSSHGDPGLRSMLATYVVPRFEVPRATYLETGQKRGPIWGSFHRETCPQILRKVVRNLIPWRMLQHSFKIASMILHDPAASSSKTTRTLDMFLVKLNVEWVALSPRGRSQRKSYLELNLRRPIWAKSHIKFLVTRECLKQPSHLSCAFLVLQYPAVIRHWCWLTRVTQAANRLSFG